MKINPIPAVPEMASLFAFIEFLRDPSKVEETAKYLESLRIALNEKIELAGKAEEIGSLRANAESDRLQAAHDLAKAREEAEKIVADAAEKAAKAAEASEAKIRGREQALAERDAAVVAKEAELADRAKALEEREREAAEKSYAGTRALGEGKALKQEYEAKLAKLRAAGVV